MTYTITANEGCWLIETAKKDDQDHKLDFWHTVQTSEPMAFEEVTDEWKQRYDLEWEVAHNPVYTEQETQQ